jgi:hypothetical protein
MSYKIDFKDLDILLFSGRGLISYTTKFFTWSPWSHMGMILIEDKPLIWECQKLNTIPDHFTKKCKNGLQKVPVWDRIKEYDGEVWYRPLLIERNEEFYSRLSIVKNTKFKSNQFCSNFFKLLNTILPNHINIGKSRGLFCSELVANIYQRMGLLDTKISYTKYSPADFDSGKAGYLFGKLERIK